MIWCGLTCTVSEIPVPFSTILIEHDHGPWCTSFCPKSVSYRIFNLKMAQIFWTSSTTLLYFEFHQVSSKHVSRMVKLKIKVWIVEGKLSIRYFSKRIPDSDHKHVTRCSKSRFASQSEIYFYALSHHVKTTERNIYTPCSTPSADLSVSLSQLSQMLIQIFYLLLENRTKKSRKFAHFFFDFSNQIFTKVILTKYGPTHFLQFWFELA